VNLSQMRTVSPVEKKANWRSSRHAVQRVTIAVTYVILVLGAIPLLVPFVWMVSTALKEAGQVLVFPPIWIPDPLRWQNFYDSLTQPYAPFDVFFTNTMIITVLSMFGQLLSASVVAFGFSRLRFWGRDKAFLVVLATMMLPHQVTLIPTFVIFKMLGWMDTFLPLIVPYFFGGGAFYIFLMRQFFMTIPLEMDDAARIDGCSTLRLYWTIILPLARPVLGTAAIFSFLAHWNDFLGPLIYLNSVSKYTLSLGLRQLQGHGPYAIQRWDLLMAASLIVMAPVLILFFTAQRYFIQGVVVSGVKG
jgi:multiple sugar transport system permease protein